MRAALRQFIVEEDGADLVEYALLLGLLSMACFLAMSTLGTSLGGFYSNISTTLDQVLP